MKKHVIKLFSCFFKKMSYGVNSLVAIDRRFFVMCFMGKT